MIHHYFNVKEMLNYLKKQDGYINEEGVYCYIFNMINTNVRLGNKDKYVINFSKIALRSNAVGKFVWYLNQYFDNETLNKIIFTNVSVIQFRQLFVSSMSYNQRAYKEMEKKSHDIEQFLAGRPQIKEKFDSLISRMDK